MRVRLTVEIELRKQSGVFVSGAETTETLIDEIDAANPGVLDIQDSVYEITEWTVYEDVREVIRRRGSGGA